MPWTEDQVLALAPDAASAKAGRGLATPGKWPLLGASDVALWGEAQGSGKNPYQTRVDLTQMGSKCSCPSRKFPCKHALGLLLLYARQPALFTQNTPPAWVSEWLEQRTQRTEKQSQKASQPVDQKAQAKRAESRNKKVAAGVDELQLWLKDLIRSGLATLPSREGTFWDSTAARMVDAQAPGLASTVRSMADIAYYTAGWEWSAWEALNQLYLVTEGFKHYEQLPPAVQEDVKTALGFTYQQEELKSKESIRDQWWVLGQQETQQERITTVKYWLKGKESARYALMLQFIVPGQPREMALVPGTQIEALLVFYPGNYPLRAIIKEQQGTQPFSPPTGYPDFQALEAATAVALAAQPWLGQLPAVLQAVTPTLVQDQLWLLDEQNRAILVTNGWDARWKLLALSGGRPVTVAGTVANQTIDLLGVWALSAYHLLG